MLFSSLVAALAFASSTAALPSSLEARQANTLDAAIKQKGRSYIGTSLTIRNDGSETNLIRSEFGSITPENGMFPCSSLSMFVR
jgi:endo-1,4-beta-xylanase